MGRQLFWFGLAAILVTLSGPAIALGSDENLIPFDIDQWLNYPERKDFSWSVDVLKPYLTLQQRFLVPVRATIDLPGSSDGHDLHFVMKVAADDDLLCSDSSYFHYPVPSQTEKSYSVNYVNGVYLRPGRYTIALIVYDSTSGKGNVLKKQVRVSRLKNDELPDLDRDLENIEFLTEAPQILRFELIHGPLAAGKEWLPVENGRGMCLDIVVNLALDSNDANAEEFGRHYANSSHVLKAASVLSHLELNNSRIQVSILDTLRVKTLYDRVHADGFDWKDAGQALLQHEDSGTIDYSALKAQTEASAYLFDLLHKIRDEDDCAAEAESPIKIVIVVSGPVEFPERTPLRQLDPQAVLQDDSPVHYYYFRILHESVVPVFDNDDDDLNAMLAPAEPEIFTIKNSRSFRKALAEFISRLEDLQ